MDEPLRCYRHPDRETYVSCAECGRGICPDCMVFGPVGIRCPDHAGRGRAKASPTRSLRQTRGRLTSVGAPATLALIAINVVVYLITISQGGGINSPGGELFFDGALIGAAVEQGDWYRLVTAAFLHGSLLHLLFNMAALWWIGSVVEENLGTARYLLVYFASALAGSAGALLLTGPLELTIGASGAVYGILGALLILEWMRTGTLAGPALTLIVLNLALTFTIPNISIGGHIGGLVGGIVATYAVSQWRYGRLRRLHRQRSTSTPTGTRGRRAICVCLACPPAQQRRIWHGHRPFGGVSPLTSPSAFTPRRRARPRRGRARAGIGAGLRDC